MLPSWNLVEWEHDVTNSAFCFEKVNFTLKLNRMAMHFSEDSIYQVYVAYQTPVFLSKRKRRYMTP